MGGSRVLTTAMPPGTKLGRYELVQSVALGGMAEIYLARTQGPQRFEKYVILKRILPHLATDERFVDMFLEEARLAATMSHSNIVQVHDFGEVDGQYFFTMEYVHGQDVRAVLKLSRKLERQISTGDAITIIANAAAGLHYAHQLEDSDGNPLGIVHRDVSPSNILVTYDGTVKVADFGIAKATQRAFSTRSGSIKGKVSYMSPEQCDGEALDRRADVFSLAIVLYELTTDRKLFSGENDLAVMRRIADRTVPRPSSVVQGYPPALEAIVMRALARDRNERHATALELQTDLERFCRMAGHVISAPSLATMMLGLFGKHPHPWAGRRLPSQITMEAGQADWDADSRPTTQVPPGSSMTSLSAMASEVALHPRAPKRRSGWIWLAAVLAVVGGAVFAANTQLDGEPSAPAASPAAAAPAVAPPAAAAPAVAPPATAAPAVTRPASTVEQPTIRERIPEPMVSEPTNQEPTIKEPTIKEPTIKEPTIKEPTTREPTKPSSAAKAAKPSSTTKPVAKPVAKSAVAKPPARPPAKSSVKPAAKPEADKPAAPPDPPPPPPTPRDIDSPFLSK